MYSYSITTQYTRTVYLYTLGVQYDVSHHRHVPIYIKCIYFHVVKECPICSALHRQLLFMNIKKYTYFIIFEILIKIIRLW